MLKLTDEQKEYFSKCPHVDHINEHFIFFKEDFKLEFYKLYCDGMMPRDIFEKFGIDVKILTENKMNGFRCKLLQKIRENNGVIPKKIHLKETSSNSDSSTKDVSNLEWNFKNAVKKIQELESIIRYKDQELTFLKKITSTTTKKEHLCSQI